MKKEKRNDENRHSITTALLFAAGLGSRLKSWTDKHPKALLPINGKSLLQRNVEYLQGYGIKNVLVNVHHFAEQIIQAITRSKGWGSHITVSDETNEVLETGGGFLKASPLLQSEGAIVLMNADILTDMNLDAMIQYHNHHKPLATLAVTNRISSRYFLFDNDRLCGWRNIKTGEQKTAQPLKGDEVQKAFSGIHIIEPELLSLIKQRGKFSMVDVYLDLMKEHTILPFDHSESKFMDVGKTESIALAEAMFG